MNKIPNANSTGNLSVSVELKNAADVFLVDSTNFRKWQNVNIAFNLYQPCSSFYQ